MWQLDCTGEYWKPVYNLLEGSFEVMVVNSHHFKQVPGLHPDVKDAEWLAELLSYGLVRGSFIPPLPQRDLRDLSRQRTTLRERTRQCDQSLAKSVGMGKSQTGICCN
jgi:transposase